MTILLDSKYWELEINKTEIELSQLVNGDLSCLKTAKSDEDSTTLQDVDKTIQAKLKYIQYCKNRYNEEIEKETKVQKKKSSLYLNRECGY